MDLTTIVNNQRLKTKQQAQQHAQMFAQLLD